MDKIKLESIREAKHKEIVFQGNKIEVKPFLSFDEQSKIIMEYIIDYFSSDYGAIIAEATLRENVISTLTNIDLEGIETENLNTLLFQTNLYDLVMDEVYNNSDFIVLLNKVLDEKKRQIEIEKSLGNVLDDLSRKIIEILNNFSSITPEQIEKLSNQTKGLLNDINNSSIAEPIKEAKKMNNKKPRKQVEYVH